jgi:hypothetical protein
MEKIEQMTDDICEIIQENGGQKMANEEFYIGQIFEGSYPPAAAVWCNANNAFIDVIGDHRYEIKEVVIPEPTQEEKEQKVRAVRDAYLAKWDFSQLRDAPFTEEEKEVLAEYRQYLRDYTKTENWWEQEPETYEDWLAAHHPVSE